MQDPSIQDNPLSNNAIQAPAMPHQLCNRTSYANTCTSCYAAPTMQTPAMRSTCCLCKPPAANSRQWVAPFRYAHQNDLTQTSCGISSLPLLWIKSYLSDRTQMIVSGESRTSWV